jgi:hypothetical protein
VPLPLSVRVTPLGSVPVFDSAGVGKPVDVTPNDPADPTVNVVDAPEVIAGAWFTVNVNDWCAGEPTPFVAFIVIEYVPPVPAAGVPASVAVPLPLSVNVTPLGSAPVSDSVAVGLAVEVTLNVPAEPTVNVVAAADVIAGAEFTVSVNDWFAGEPTPFVAVMVIGYEPAVPAAGVPPMVAVPLPLSVNVTPLGNVPDFASAGAGEPVVVTWNDCEVPTVNVAEAAEVIAATWFTVSVNDWFAGEPTPFVAVIVIGYEPAVPAAGVPASVADPLPLSMNVTPLGSVPVLVSVGAGKPVVVTANVPALPTVKAVLLADVIVGASGWLETVSVKPWLAGEPTPFVALIVIG